MVTDRNSDAHQLFYSIENCYLPNKIRNESVIIIHRFLMKCFVYITQFFVILDLTVIIWKIVMLLKHQNH